MTPSAVMSKWYFIACNSENSTRDDSPSTRSWDILPKKWDTALKAASGRSPPAQTSRHRHPAWGNRGLLAFNRQPDR